MDQLQDDQLGFEGSLKEDRKRSHPLEIVGTNGSLKAPSCQGSRPSSSKTGAHLVRGS